MKKQKIAMTMLKQYGFKIFSAGYCELQDVIPNGYYQFYNSGVYGWNCDVYIDFVNHVIITTGYRNMRGATIPSELVKKYSDVAKEIRKNYRYDDYLNRINENAKRFCQELSTLKRA